MKKPPSPHAWRSLSLKHPLTRLKNDVSRAKLPLPVRRQVWDLFRQVKNPGSLTQEQAQHEARRLECHIQLLRVRHGLMLNDPSSREHFTLSKSASLWLRNLDKATKDAKLNRHAQPDRRSVPTAAARQSQRADDEADGDDGSNGETA